MGNQIVVRKLIPKDRLTHVELYKFIPWQHEAKYQLGLFGCKQQKLTLTNLKKMGNYWRILGGSQNWWEVWRTTFGNRTGTKSAGTTQNWSLPSPHSHISLLKMQSHGSEGITAKLSHMSFCWLFCKEKRNLMRNHCTKSSEHLCLVSKSLIPACCDNSNLRN